MSEELKLKKIYNVRDEHDISIDDTSMGGIELIEQNYFDVDVFPSEHMWPIQFYTDDDNNCYEIERVFPATYKNHHLSSCFISRALSSGPTW